MVPEDIERARQALDKAGFRDIGEQAAGDHEWIYHSSKDALIVDVIWRFANLANYVSRDWLDRAARGTFLGKEVMFMPLEELIWIKVFVINRHRCDWPDVMRVIRFQCGNIDWDRLLGLIAENWLLLEGLIAVFDWQHPGSTGCVPTGIRQELARRHEEYLKHPVNVEREHLLDPWLHQRLDRYEDWRYE